MKIAATLIPIAILSACATLPADDPQQAFFARLSALCGQAFDGRIASPPVEADRDFAGKRLTMHVRDCSDSEIRIPFRVGEDRSRTWVIRRQSDGSRGAATLTLIPIALLSSCSTIPSDDPQQAFFARLSALCGQAFDGRIASPPVDADRDFAGKRLLMHVRDCSEDEIRIPFAVGDDRSRTWVIRRRPALSLHHDHRHADGSEDRLTRYGGAASAEGSESRQLFPADDYSRGLFVRENIPQSANNVWALEVQPGATFAYELRRPGRFFRVEFDLDRPVAPIPASSH